MKWRESNIFIIYTILISIISIFILLKKNYKKSQFLNLSLKEHPLKFVYGSLAYLVDLTSTFSKNKYSNKQKTKLEKISLSQNIKLEKDIYIVSKLSIALAVFIFIVIIGYIKCIEAKFSPNKEITEIERADYGDGPKEYILNVKNSKQTTDEKIKLKIKERVYSNKEANQVLDENFKELKKIILGKNKSFDHITTDLDLVSEMNNYIQADWDISEPDYIDYTGKISWDKIKDKYETSLKVKLILDKYEKDFTIPITITAKEKSNSNSLEQQIEEIVNKQAQDSKKVQLPVEVNGNKISFYKKHIKGSYVYIIFGFLGAILIYVLKDKDLDNKVKKRNMQMQLDYAGIVNKITLLQSSGMTILNAWDKVIDDYNLQKENIGSHYAYEEMKIARQKLGAGYSQSTMFTEFGRKCGIQSYIKFGNLLEQNLKKGSKGLKEVLKLEVTEAFEERKAMAKKHGEEVGTKLLFPMGIMLIISLIIIMVPAFMSLGF